MIRRTALLVLFILVGAAAPMLAVNIDTIPLVTNLTDPLAVVDAKDGTGRLFILEQCGKIRILKNGSVLSAPFLDLGVSGLDRIACGGERGSLGLAFHPLYSSNGFFYVYYTRKSDGAITIARFHVSTNADLADTASELVMLTIPHPSQANHNGGSLGFGPDGYLYIGTGDGGGAGDPFENGQSLNVLLGKILRIDVNVDDFPADSTRNYGIPSTNPFAGTIPGSDEIWAYGLRNPWRFSFDKTTGDLVIGDVGQGAWEEVDFQPAGTAGGRNYGWDCREGAHNFTDTNGDQNVNCASVSSIDPVTEYDHSLGCSITGGYVFRNLTGSPLTGHYLFSDFCSGRLWEAPTSTWVKSEILSLGGNVTSFGEGQSGRIYYTRNGSGTGSLTWLAPYTFTDVHPNHWAWSYVEALKENGVTTGCTSSMFCPDDALNRAQTVVLLGRAAHPGYTPPPATGVFSDVPTTDPAAAWIEQADRDGVTHGCRANPRAFCPNNSVSRAEMAVFLVRFKHGPSFTPAAATGIFQDVPTTYWAASFIEQVYRDGITQGCAANPLRFCPESLLPRAEGAAFIARAAQYALP